MTHRPSVAARADLVVWLEDGRVRAVGPHRLLWREAAYRAVFGAREEGAEAPSHDRDGETAAGPADTLQKQARP